jgi:Protein of unknown function (DUF3617)
MVGIKPATILALIGLTFPGAAWLSAEDRMRAGRWEVTTALNGTPSGASHNTCYTPAMVALANSPAKTLREATEKSSAKTGCTVKDFKMDGNTISMTQVCGARMLVVSSTYSLDAFDTVATSTEAGVSRATRMKGRRIGDCK